MSRELKRTRILVVLVCAGVAFGMGCCAEKSPPPAPVEKDQFKEVDDPPDTQEVPLEALMLEEARTFDEKRTHPKVGVVTVKRGQALRFVARGITAWILIPDGNLRRGMGGYDWSETDSYIAFKIESGRNASVRVPDTYPQLEKDKEIHYSILAFDGTIWEYIHGNSPPRVIIPR